MAKVMVLIGFVASLLFLSLIAYSFPIFAQGPDSAPGKPEVIAVSGIVPGKDLIVHIWVVVPHGADRNEAASAALANQGARPFTLDEFSTIALKWDQFSDSDPTNNFVIQYYNPANDPTVNDPTGNGEDALTSTHASWTNVVPSIFAFKYEGTTDRCPSLVKECSGPQTFDGNNDVAWLRLSGPNTLGVTWSGTSIDEADMALNTKFNWATDGVDDADFDVETVYLHENGHAAGLGHSADINAIMYPSYQQLNRVLQLDDINGINFLYPGPVLPNDPDDELFPNAPTNNSPAVGVDSITYSTVGGKNGDKHLTVSVHVSDDSENNVSGASVSIILLNGNSSWSATGTTSSTGDAGFTLKNAQSGYTLKNAPSGTYTTTITIVIASGLNWDGLTPPNSFTK